MACIGVNACVGLGIFGVFAEKPRAVTLLQYVGWTSLEWGAGLGGRGGELFELSQ